MKVQIKQEVGLTRVLLDGQDISNSITALDVELKSDCVPIVKFEIVPDEIDVYGDFDVLKNIKSDNVQTGININIQSAQNSGLIEYLTKCIVMYQHEMTKSNRCLRRQ